MAWYILGLFSRISDGHSYPFYPIVPPPPRDNRPLLQSKRHTADENTDWLYFIIRDCRLLFHKNDCSYEFIDTNYYKQNKQNDDFELYVTKDHFYKAYGTLPTKTPTDFDQYVTAA